MIRTSETALLNSVKSLLESIKMHEATPTRSDVTKAIGASEHPMQGFSDYMNKGKDTVNTAIGDLASGIGHSIGDPLKQGIPVAKEIARGVGEVGKGAYNNIANHVSSTFAQDNKDWGIDRFGGGADTNPIHTAPADDLSGPSDLDNVPAYTAPSTGSAPKPHTTATSKPHPAGLPKAPTAKFDPAIQKLQYELRQKGYPDIPTNGILDAKTQKIIDWERMSAERDSRISGYDDLKAAMDQPIAEDVTFRQEESLARIIQLSRG